jgi:hypothetical protein
MPLAQSFDDANIARMVAVLGARQHAEPLLVSDFSALQNHAHSLGADRYGLLHEDMLARPHRLQEVDGAEGRGRAVQHQVHTTVDDMLIGVQPEEAALFGHLGASGEFGFQPFTARLEPIGEHIAQRIDNGALVGAQAVHRCARAAPPAADKPDPKRVGACRVGKKLYRQRTKRHRGGQARCPAQKLTPREGCARLLNRLCCHLKMILSPLKGRFLLF